MIKKIGFFKDFLWGGPNLTKGVHMVIWAYTQKPFLYRDLGIGNIKLINSSLLAKWVWKFIIGKKALWRKVIQEKYKILPNMSWPINSCHISSTLPWFHLSKEITTIQTKAKCRTSDVNSIKFWTDFWLDQGPLNTNFLKLLKLTTKPNITISDT